MRAEQTIPLGEKTLISDNNNQRNGNGLPIYFCQQKDYMTTKEAAAYLGKSVSWFVRLGDIPYLPGKPNIYCRSDLDDWFTRHKHIPKMLQQ